MDRFDAREAAEAVIGAALADAEALTVALGMLSPEMFYLDPHRLIFHTLMDLAEEGIPPDLVTVTRWLNDQGTLAKVGGAAEISSLIDRTPDVANVEWYAKAVRVDWARREALAATKNLEDQLANGAPMDAALRRHQVEVSEVLEVDGPVRVEFGADVWKDLQQDIPIGKKFGMPGFDDLGGLLPGIYILAARPGKGKSTMLAQATVGLIETGLKTLVVSAEMPRWKWAGWMLSSMTGTPYRNLSWPPDERYREVLGSPLFGFYRRHGVIDVDDLVAALRECKPDVLILDHVGKMRSKDPRESRTENLQRCMDVLHGLSLEQGFMVLAAAHLGRDIEKTGRRPQLSDLRESGSFENVSDVVAYLYPAPGEEMDGDTVEMVFDVDKNRHFGELPRVELAFHRPTRMFVHSSATQKQAWR